MEEKLNKSDHGRNRDSWLGFAVKGAGWLGVAFSLLLMAALPFLMLRFRGSLLQVVGEGSDLLGSAGTSLGEAGGSIGDLAEVLDTIVETLQSASASMLEAEDLSETAFALLDEQIPQTIDNTVSALTAVEAASGEIDSVLTALDTISFLTGVEYDPETPLDEAVAGVAGSLDPISESMQDISQSLLDSTDELVSTAESLQLLSEQLVPYGERLAGTADALILLSEQLSSAAENLDSLHSRVPGILVAVLILLELLLLWSLLSHAAVYTVGDRLMIAQPAPADAEDDAEDDAN